MMFDCYTLITAHYKLDAFAHSLYVMCNYTIFYNSTKHKDLQDYANLIMLNDKNVKINKEKRSGKIHFL